MTACRWNPEAATYLIDGEPCKRDEYGDPTRHCTARRTCSQHIGADELTCARCLLRTKQDIRQIELRAAMMLPEAMRAGVNSEAANMAGPAADYRVFSARRTIAKQWIFDHIHQPARDWCDDPECTRRHFKTDKGDRWHKRGLENALSELVDDDDEHHPYNVLTRWHMMLAEDYGLKLPAKMTISDSADFLVRIVGRLAQDPEQDFRLFRTEMRTCRSHLEAVLHDSLAPEKGAPCPTCVESAKVDPAKVRLVRRYAHWCTDEDCTEQFHVVTDDFDVWVCQRNREHWWTAAGYAELIEARKAVAG